MIRFIPNFKITLIVIGFLYVFMSAGLFFKGLMISMSEFQVPQSVLNSPHYFDAIFWVYAHMITIGILFLCIGISVTELPKQKWLSIILFIISTFYTYLDFRSSDSVLGNGLYKGESSLVPGVIGSLISLILLLLILKLFINDNVNKDKFKSAL